MKYSKAALALALGLPSTSLIKKAKGDDSTCKDGTKPNFVQVEPQYTSSYHPDHEPGYKVDMEFDLYNKCTHEIIAWGKLEYDSSQHKKATVPVCGVPPDTPLELCFKELTGPYWVTDSHGNNVDDGNPCAATYGSNYRHLKSGGDDGQSYCCSDIGEQNQCPANSYVHCGGTDENCCSGGVCHSHGDEDENHPTFVGGKCVCKRSRCTDSAPYYYSKDTGNFYEVVQTPCVISWKSAKSAAAARSYGGVGGKLVTIESLAENNFIKNLPTFEFGFTPFSADINFKIGPWIGGGRSPSGGYKWLMSDGVTPSFNPFATNDGTAINGAFEDFEGGEPNSQPANNDKEAYITWVENQGNVYWGDAYDGESAVKVTSYIVEYETKKTEHACDPSDFPKTVPRQDAFPASTTVSDTYPHKKQCKKFFEIVDYTSCPVEGFEDPAPEGLSWSTSRRTARTYFHKGCQGNLASVRSQDESNALKAQFTYAEPQWSTSTGFSTNFIIGAYIGGEYTTQWCWITDDECFTGGSGGGGEGNAFALNGAFNDWNTNTPNNVGETYMAYVSTSGSSPPVGWDDAADFNTCGSNRCPIPSFVIEYDCCDEEK